MIFNELFHCHVSFWEVFAFILGPTNPLKQRRAALTKVWFHRVSLRVSRWVNGHWWFGQSWPKPKGWKRWKVCRVHDSTRRIQITKSFLEPNWPLFCRGEGWAPFLWVTKIRQNAGHLGSRLKGIHRKLTAGKFENPHFWGKGIGSSNSLFFGFHVSFRRV